MAARERSGRLAAVDVRPQVGGIDPDRSHRSRAARQFAFGDEREDGALGDAQQFAGLLVGEQLFDGGRVRAGGFLWLHTLCREAGLVRTMVEGLGVVSTTALRTVRSGIAAAAGIAGGITVLVIAGAPLQVAPSVEGHSPDLLGQRGGEAGDLLQRALLIFLPPQANLWVIGGSGRWPSWWYRAVLTVSNRR